MAYETNDSVWWEVEGLSSAGTWHGVYQGRTESEGRKLLAAAVMDDAPCFDRYLDFRLTRPGVGTAPEDWHGYAWDRRVWSLALRARQRLQRAREAEQPLARVPTKKKARRGVPAVG